MAKPTLKDMLNSITEMHDEMVAKEARREKTAPLSGETVALRDETTQGVTDAESDPTQHEVPQRTRGSSQ